MSDDLARRRAEAAKKAKAEQAKKARQAKEVYRAWKLDQKAQKKRAEMKRRNQPPDKQK